MTEGCLLGIGVLVRQCLHSGQYPWRRDTAMRRLVICLSMMVVVCVAGCATGRSVVKPGYDFGLIERVAVVQVDGALRSNTARNQVADYFNSELLERGYNPIERAQVEALLSEQEFQASDLTSAAGIARAGQILNVDAVVLVNIGSFGEEISMTAKLVDVEDASILWVGEGSGGTGSTVGTIAGAALGAGTGVALGGTRRGRIVGGAVGGVLGGVAGRALSRQELTATRKVIGKLCRALPSKVPLRR